MSVFRRALSSLFPATRRTIATFPNTAEAIRFARELVAQGRRVNISVNDDTVIVRQIGGAA